MGFTITGSLFKTNQHGELKSMYGRITAYRFDKTLGEVVANVSLYKDAKSAKSNQNINYPNDFTEFQGLIGNNLEIVNGEETTSVSYPSLINIPMTSSVDVEVPIFTNHIVSESVSYYDFDDNGNVVEKSKWEYFSQSVQIGTQIERQDIINTELVIGNPFPFIYNIVTSIYKDIFGNENIINS